MKKFTKILALAAVVAAVASLTACGKKDDVNDVATIEQTVEQTAEDTADAAVTAEGSDEAVTAEAGASAAEMLIGTWTLAGVNGDTVENYAASIGVTADDVQATVVIDESSYTSTTTNGTATVEYTPTETGLSVQLTEDSLLYIEYDAASDTMSYSIPVADSEGNVSDYVFSFARA